jgi:hypothetical protein
MLRQQTNASRAMIYIYTHSMYIHYYTNTHHMVQNQEDEYNSLSANMAVSYLKTSYTYTHSNPNLGLRSFHQFDICIHS